MKRTLSTLFMPLLISCGGSSGPRQLATITDSAGIRIVSNGETRGLMTRRVNGPVFRTGWKDGDPTFEVIAGGALRADGSAAVLDDGGKRLYLISSDGSGVKAVGREGDGPGEFRSGETVEMAVGDSIIVFDYMAGRLSLFDLNGSFLGSGRWVGSGPVDSKPSSILNDGRLGWTPSGYSVTGGGESGVTWLTASLLASTPLGEMVDTLVTLPMFEVRREGGRIVSDPFQRYAAAEAYVDGFIWSRNDLAEVKWFSTNGEVTQVARWIAKPRTVDETVWSEYEAAYRERMGSSPERGSDQQLQESLDKSRRNAAQELPLFRFLHAGSDGSAWLSEYTMVGMPARDFVVFDSGGNASRVRFPRALMVLDVRDSHVLGVEVNEFGVQAVVVYEVEP